MCADMPMFRTRWSTEDDDDDDDDDEDDEDDEDDDEVPSSSSACATERQAVEEVDNRAVPVLALAIPRMSPTACSCPTL